jgi:hypothetical protein
LPWTRLALAWLIVFLVVCSSLAAADLIWINLFSRPRLVFSTWPLPLTYLILIALSLSLTLTSLAPWPNLVLSALTLALTLTCLILVPLAHLALASLSLTSLALPLAYLVLTDLTLASLTLSLNIRVLILNTLPLPLALPPRTRLLLNLSLLISTLCRRLLVRRWKIDGGCEENESEPNGKRSEEFHVDFFFVRLILQRLLMVISLRYHNQFWQRHGSDIG